VQATVANITKELITGINETCSLTPKIISDDDMKFHIFPPGLTDEQDIRGINALKVLVVPSPAEKDRVRNSFKSLKEENKSLKGTLVLVLSSAANLF
ncbi:hypothetical protein H0H87_003619, partial [Tephrocybe sp. NHM501043]